MFTFICFFGEILTEFGSEGKHDQITKLSQIAKWGMRKGITEGTEGECFDQKPERQ